MGHGSGWRAFRRLRAAHPSAAWPFFSTVDVGGNIRRIEQDLQLFFIEKVTHTDKHTAFAICHCRYILQNLTATTGAKKFLMAKNFDWNSWVLITHWSKWSKSYLGSLISFYLLLLRIREPVHLLVHGSSIEFFHI